MPKTHPASHGTIIAGDAALLLPPGTDQTRLMQLLHRAERGLISYNTLSINTLQEFAASRRLPHLLTEKGVLIRLLERADDRVVFSRFMDLPVELRVRIYEHHFDSFDFVSAEPAPTLSICRLVRTESRPVFYERTRMRILIGHDLLSATSRQDREQRINHLGRRGLCARLSEELDTSCVSRIT